MGGRGSYQSCCCGGAELQDRLLLLTEDVWKEGKVVKDWQDAEIVPMHTQEERP